MNLSPLLNDRLKNQHEVIETIISTIDAPRRMVRPQPNKWNIHDIIAHLARYQPIFIGRINQVLVNDAPSFGRYNPDEDPEFDRWRILDKDTLIKTLKKDRQTIYNLITGLSDEQLNRTGIHPKFGSLTINQWTEFFLLHEAHHLFIMFQLATDKTL